jgi:Cu2+-exporting ATPase
VAWILLGEGSAFAMERAVTVMVISCPHALGLAVPLVVAVSTSLAAKSGLLIRDRQAFERAKDLQAVVFDKTGTLTEGKFGVTDIITLAEMDEKEILGLTASLEASSEHPIAAGIVNSSKERGIEPVHVHDFRALPGKGVEGLIQGKRLRVVSPGYLGESKIELKVERIEKLSSREDSRLCLR